MTSNPAPSFREYVNRWYEQRLVLRAKELYCQVHITMSCQNSCDHCYFKDLLPPSQRELPYESVRLIADRISETARELSRSPRIDLTGGDPLLHRSFLDIAEYLSSQGIAYGLKCNPDALEDQLLVELRRLGVREITVSVDGFGFNHDSLRGSRSFEKTMRTIGLLKERGFVVGIHWTLTKTNALDLVPFQKFLLENGFIIDNLTWGRLWSEGTAERAVDRTALLQLLHSLCGFYESLFETPEFFYVQPGGVLVPKLFVGFLECLWYPFFAERGFVQPLLARDIDHTRNSINCAAIGHSYIVDPDGSVYKCRKLVSSRIGNILASPLSELLRSPVAERFANLGQHSKCGSCRYFNGCGGCAAMAKMKHQSMWSGDPDCFVANTPCGVLL